MAVAATGTDAVTVTVAAEAVVRWTVAAADRSR
jgi:hypothetical protein